MIRLNCQILWIIIFTFACYTFFVTKPLGLVLFDQDACYRDGFAGHRLSWTFLHTRYNGRGPWPRPGLTWALSSRPQPTQSSWSPAGTRSPGTRGISDTWANGISGQQSIVSKRSLLCQFMYVPLRKFYTHNTRNVIKRLVFKLDFPPPFRSRVMCFKCPHWVFKCKHILVCWLPTEVGGHLSTHLLVEVRAHFNTEMLCEMRTLSSVFA